MISFRTSSMARGLHAWIGVAATVATLIPASLAWGTTWITMRDGVRLAADVYLPTGTPPWPVILTRTPYNRQTDAVDPEWIQDVNNRGSVYVVKDTRGRFESEGADSVFWTDGWGALQDGYDTIEWIAVQS